jgi:hypothetical protein
MLCLNFFYWKKTNVIEILLLFSLNTSFAYVEFQQSKLDGISNKGWLIQEFKIVRVSAKRE